LKEEHAKILDVIETSQPEVMTPAEVAELFRVPESWVYEKVRPRCKDPLPVRRVGKYLRFDRAKVLAWFHGTPAPVSKKSGRKT
jgi:predicted DNA-binding transcriptional regulator AlpA